jgi:hypothetical protein
MKTKRLVFLSCFAAAALIASPALGNPPQKKTMVASSSAHQRTAAARTTQVTPTYRYSGTSSARYYGGTRYGSTGYYGGTRYYYGGGFGYPYYGYYSYWPYSYYGYYPYSSYYPYDYSYYGGPTYGYDRSMVAEVQRRLAELGYYNGLIDGIMGPRTRAAISVYESTHSLIVDGTISPRLLRIMGLS